MKGLLIVAFCAVCSVQAWTEDFGPIHVHTHSYTPLPPKYFPLTSDDSWATRKAGSFVNFIKILPQLNPLKIRTLGPYNVYLPGLNIHGNLHLSNVVVNGLKNVAVNGLELRRLPNRNRVDFNGSVPLVTADVNFAFNGVLNKQNLNINGQVSARLQGLSVSGAVGPNQRVINSQSVFQADSAAVNIDIEDLQATVTMNQFGENFHKFAVHFLKNTHQYSSVLSSLVGNVLEAVNHELTQLPAKEVNQYLTGSSKPSLFG